MNGKLGTVYKGSKACVEKWIIILLHVQKNYGQSILLLFPVNNIQRPNSSDKFEDNLNKNLTRLEPVCAIVYACCFHNG